MEDRILGLHHITAIAGSAKRNLGFYTGVLGLRLLKKTVNFDDPKTSHFYYGDEAGSPGTLLTFFPWGDVVPGRRGSQMATEIGYSVPEQLGTHLLLLPQYEPYRKEIEAALPKLD